MFFFTICLSFALECNANAYSEDSFHVINSEYYTETGPITLVIVGTIILIKKAAGTKAVSIGLGYAKKILGLTGTALTIENLYSRVQSKQELNRLTALMEMSDDDLYRFCLQLGGGMASTMDARQDQWGEKYIFGVIRPHDTAYYAGAVCVSG